jgi:hypothetical protein
MEDINTGKKIMRRRGEQRRGKWRMSSKQEVK